MATDMDKAPILFDHIERYLGQINASWMDMLDGEQCPFQVARCAGGVEDTVFFCTLGLGNYPLKGRAGAEDKAIRHELLIAVPRFFGTRNVPPLLQQLGMISLNRKKAFWKGEVIQGTNPVFAAWPFRGFYVSHPCVIAADEFAECRREDGEPVNFVWMAPLYQVEIDFVKKHGVTRLEEIFMEKEMDLVDLNRKAAVE
jgi:hypothetical protein